MGSASGQVPTHTVPAIPLSSATTKTKAASPRHSDAIPTDVSFVDASGTAGQLLLLAKFNPVAWERKPAKTLKPGAAPDVLVAALPTLVAALPTLVAALPTLVDADFNVLSRFVREGGRVLLLAPQEAGIAERFGLTVQQVSARHLQPINPHHPIFQKLPLKEITEGWGVIAPTVPAVQRPVTGGWLPLLLTENTEYSPLLEVRYGKGRLILCTLDLRAGAKPAVMAHLLRNLITYLASPVQPRSTKTLYIGPVAREALLKRLDIRYSAASHFTPDAHLVFIAPEARTGVNLLIEREFIQRGGRVLVLPTRKADSEVQEGSFRGVVHLPNWPETQGIVLSDLHPVQPINMLLLPQTTAVAEGLLARVSSGRGVLMQTQIDPSLFAGTEDDTTRHFDRALATLFANAGAAFITPVIREEGRVSATRPLAVPLTEGKPLTEPEKSDIVKTIPAKPLAKPADKAVSVPQVKPKHTLAAPAVEVITLKKGWRVRQTLRLPGNDTEKPDPGISLQAKALVNPDGFDEEWDPFDAPANYAGFDIDDGEAVFRITVNLPANWAGQTLELSLGMLDDNDNTYFNGVAVGATQGKTKLRMYNIPSGLVHAGKNVIAVRLFDTGGTGGFLGPADSLKLTIKKDQ